MTAVLRGEDDVEPLLAHQLAHRLPSSISLCQRKPGIRIEFRHKKDSALRLISVDFFDYSRRARPVTITKEIGKLARFELKNREVARAGDPEQQALLNSVILEGFYRESRGN